MHGMVFFQTRRSKAAATGKMTEEAIADKFEPSPLINLPEEVSSSVFEKYEVRNALPN
jgi:hypothetical protein